MPTIKSRSTAGRWSAGVGRPSSMWPRRRGAHPDAAPPPRSAARAPAGSASSASTTCSRPLCTEPVADGMKIVTADPEITAMRRGILEFLLAGGRRPACNYLYCEANGGCELQALCHEHGLDTPPPAGCRNARTRGVSSARGCGGENRCVLCGPAASRPPRRDPDEPGVGLRRPRQPRPPDHRRHRRAGRIRLRPVRPVRLCPTGALSFQTVLGRGQAWELTRQSSICIYCGVGCKIDFFTNRDSPLLVKAEGALDGPNEGHLYVKGRFGFDFVQSPKRLTQPLVRKDGELHGPLHVGRGAGPRRRRSAGSRPTTSPTPSWHSPRPNSPTGKTTSCRNSCAR